jgi:hypothetical protein
VYISGKETDLHQKILESEPDKMMRLRNARLNTVCIGIVMVLEGRNAQKILLEIMLLRLEQNGAHHYGSGSGINTVSTRPNRKRLKGGKF